MNDNSGSSAILGTFAAYLRAEAAMLMIMLLAFRSAGIANSGA